MAIKRNSIVTSGVTKDTAKDTVRNSGAAIGFRLVELAARIRALQCEVEGDYIPNIQKGIPGGVATLDVTGVLDALQVPPYLLGAINYQGTWDASGGVPPAPAVPANKGHYYIISVDGTIGGVNYFVGDLIVSTGATWERIDGASSSFTHLSDTPASYVGQALKATRVNAAQTALEFFNALVEVEQTNIIYVSKSGDNLNNGLTLEKAKLTFTNALTVAVAGDTVFCQDKGIYTESIVVPIGVTLYAPNATIVGTGINTIEMDGETYVSFYSVVATGTNNCVKRILSANAEPCYIVATILIVAQGIGCFSAQPSGVISIKVDQLYIGDTGINDGIGIGDITGVEVGNIIFDIDIIIMNGDNCYGITNNGNGLPLFVAGKSTAVLQNGANCDAIYSEDSGIILINAFYVMSDIGIQMRGTNSTICANINYCGSPTGYDITGAGTVLNLSLNSCSGTRIVGAGATDNYNCAVGEFKRQITILDTDSPYTVLPSDCTLFCNTTAGDITVLLPTAVDYKDRVLDIKRISAGTNVLTLQAFGAETIDGLNSLNIDTQYDSYTIHSNGTNWFGVVTSFIHLTDTPSTYVGQSRKLVRVNELETLLEYQDAIPNILEVVESGNAGMYTTIAAAITDAVAGDVIMVRNGVYTENLIIDKQITIKGDCALETQINGKITFSPNSAVKVVISQIGIVNTNDFCIDCQPTNDSAILKCVDVRLEATWTTSPGGSSPTIAKSCVKLSRGSFINRGAANAVIVASGDNHDENNTCIYWVTGSDIVYLESFGVIHSVTNSTDAKQNVEIMFNNNTNVNGIVIIKNGFCRLTGVVGVDNFIAPFYMLSSNNTGYIDGNILFLFNSGHSYATFHYLGAATSEFSNNSIIHSGITISEIYVAITLTTTGRIKVINNYYDVNFIPKVAGNVEYFYSNANGDTYHSKGLTARLLPINNDNYTVLDNDGVYTIIVSAGAADRTILLPTAADNINRVITIKKIDAGAGNVIIDGEGVQTIDGAVTQTIGAQYDSYTIQCDGSNWWII